jgi:hypothetical protein
MNANMNLKIAGICKSFFTIRTKLNINIKIEIFLFENIYQGYGLSFVCRRT